MQALSVFSSSALEDSFQAGSTDLPTNCRNKLGELDSEEPTRFTSL